MSGLIVRGVERCKRALKELLGSSSVEQPAEPSAPPPVDPTAERLQQAEQRLGPADAAIVRLCTVIRADPMNADALNDLGMLLESKGELYAAACCYVDALGTRFEFPEAEFNLVCVRQRLFGGNL